MSLFPRVTSPCPYKSELSAVMDGDFCRMCKRNVVDLNGMSSDERVAFLGACEEEVCVSYSIPIRPAIAAAALAAAALTMPTAAAAQEVEDYGEMIIVGGITDPKNATFVETAEDASVPELPVVYEDEAAPDEGKAPAASGPAGS